MLPDRTSPMDFEVYDVTGATGFGTSAEEKQEFLPFYATTDRTGHGQHRAFYSVQRSPRALSARQGRYGARSSYVGSEVYLSLVDAEETAGTFLSSRGIPTHGSAAPVPSDEAGAPAR